MGTDQHTRDEGDGAYGSREAAEGWRCSAAERAQRLGLATESMLNLANIAIGSRILDVAAGTGEQTILAARRVGPAGSVLATDIAAKMLKIAAEAALQAGLCNVTTQVMDARQLDVEAESFDAAISRLGLMFVSDLPGALAGIRRALKPGGKLAAIVVSSAEKNRYLALPLEIACRHGRRPASALDRIGLFSLGSPAVLEAALTKAGFSNVTVQAVPIRRWHPSRAEALQERKNACPELGELMVDLSDAERAIAWSEIEQAIGQFEGPSGVEVSGEVLVGAGTK
jgi:ubiquinone/menaquinone biosynthesis C-methylase UbiE